jgi:hypothetical protein
VTLEVEGIRTVCPLGEVVGSKMIAEGKIPVISCEGGCFRGEISRVAAHMVAAEEPYSRGCHGEMFTAPRSAMAEWARNSDKVVVIDGCFMHCHGRIMKNIVGSENTIQFDALPMYNRGKKYSDTMHAVGEFPFWWAIGFALNSPFLVVFSFLYLPVWLYFCWAEEQDLSIRYGASYEEYRERVGFWFPKK